MKRISKKREAILKAENILRDAMIKHQLDTVGYIYCMLCGRSAPLEKNHTRYRKRFVMSCRECHRPGGVHKYLQGED